MKLSFETIRFAQKPSGVYGLLLRYFKFFIPAEDLERVGAWRVEDGALVFDAHEKKRTLAMGLLAQALRERLVCTVTDNPAVYVDELSGVPLLGALEFGIIDRGTNLIEVRPMSGCNLQCTYCSVAEGPGGPKQREFVIQKEYFLEEFAKVAAVKTKPMEVFIETQGEPTLYWELPELIAGLRERFDVKKVTMVTNGTLLTQERLDAYVDAGLDQINWSINALDPELAEKIAGARYDVNRVKDAIVRASQKLDVLMCPVIMRGVNEQEMESFVEFAQTFRDEEPLVGFQNFLYYKGGRNPVKEVGWEGFNARLEELEKKYSTRLKLDAEDFSVEYDETLDKPFKKKEYVEVERLFAGRLGNETFCKASGRVVKVLGRVPDKERFRVQIIRDKHNIFLAKVA